MSTGHKCQVANTIIREQEGASKYNKLLIILG